MERDSQFSPHECRYRANIRQSVRIYDRHIYDSEAQILAIWHTIDSQGQILALDLRSKSFQPFEWSPLQPAAGAGETQTRV
jgi:hypothetical protein